MNRLKKREVVHLHNLKLNRQPGKPYYRVHAGMRNRRLKLGSQRAFVEGRGPYSACSRRSSQISRLPAWGSNELVRVRVGTHNSDRNHYTGIYIYTKYIQFVLI